MDGKRDETIRHRHDHTRHSTRPEEANGHERQNEGVCVRTLSIYIERLGRQASTFNVHPAHQMRDGPVNEVLHWCDILVRTAAQRTWA